MIPAMPFVLHSYQVAPNRVLYDRYLSAPYPGRHADKITVYQDIKQGMGHQRWDDRARQLPESAHDKAEKKSEQYQIREIDRNDGSHGF
jgi:hypothetical protein